MKKNILFLFVLFVTVLALNAQEARIFRQEGIASWYGREFEGRPTASGEIFSASQLTAAHPTLPFGTSVVVTNQHNNRSVVVRINDRGPFVPARIIDVSRAAAEHLDMIVTGTAPVVVQSVESIVLSPPPSPAAPVIAAVQAPPQITAVYAPTVQSAAPAVSQPAPVTAASPQAVVSVIRLTPQINITPEKNYRLQVGSYRLSRNATEAFQRLQNAGLNPAYERFTDAANNEYYRVVVANVRGSDIQLTTERISAAGFREALIREEN